jgi:hypothetical protein
MPDVWHVCDRRKTDGFYPVLANSRASEIRALCGWPQPPESAFDSDNQQYLTFPGTLEQELAHYPNDEVCGACALLMLEVQDGPT